MRQAMRESYDLFLLDWIVPDVPGDRVLEWLRRERHCATPVIFVTSRESEEDIAAALGAGADDYVCKPVRRLEIQARITAVLRRTGHHAEQGGSLEVAPFRFEIPTRQAAIAGEPVELTEKEFELAVFLFRNLGRLISRGHLLEVIWGKTSDIATRTIDTHISRVRSKLMLRPEKGFRLVPIYNFGYRLERVSTTATEAVKTASE